MAQEALWVPTAWELFFVQRYFFGDAAWPSVSLREAASLTTKRNKEHAHFHLDQAVFASSSSEKLAI